LNDGKPAKVTKSQSFNDFANQLIESMFATNQTGNATIYKTATNHFLMFVNHRKLKFTEVNYVLLESFKTTLIKEGIKPDSISNYFRTFRAIYNKATDAADHHKLVVFNFYKRITSVSGRIINHSIIKQFGAAILIFI
jgi:integrase/recombinase XerD